jgi:hypothetical protein
MKFIYEFSLLDLEEIENLYGKFRKYGVGKFLDLIYRKTIRAKDFDNKDSYLNNNGFCYVSKVEIERYLGNGKNENGEYYWNIIIKSLSKRGIIKYRRSGNNKFNFNKQLWFFRLNENFFKCKKFKREIEDKNLIKWLNKRNDIKLEKWLGVKEIGKKKEGDYFVGYEIDVCRRSDLIIEDLDLVIDIRVSNKLKEINDKLTWDWISEKERGKLLEKIINDDWINEYKFDLKNKYQIIQDDLNYLKNREYGELSDDYFKRDQFGGRVYNLYSNVVREYRRYIKIDGEEVVEIDLKNSMICCLYYLVKELNKHNYFNSSGGERFEEIYWELSKLNNGWLSDNDRSIKLGINYIDRWDYILNNSNNLNKDYYNFLMEEFKNSIGLDISRNSFKELLFVVLFGNNKQLKNLKLNGLSYSEIEILMLGSSRFLVNDLKNISLFNWYKNINYRKYKNVSLILMRMERKLMDELSSILISNGYSYLSLFDGFIVKRKEGEEIIKQLNNWLEKYDKVFRLILK